jgi:hypothetical protein
MPSFKTIYRAAIMIAVGAIVIKAWQLYGPTSEQVKSTVAKAIEMGHAVLNRQQGSNSDARLVSGPENAPVFAGGVQESAALNPALPPALNQPQAVGTTAPANELPGSPLPTTPELIAAPPAKGVAAIPGPERIANVPAAADERVTALMSKLEKLGASEAKLSAWGSSGNLYRFCCRATPPESPALAQHFESVAAEPAVAVEQVLAKVEAWHTARQSDALLR